MSNRPDPEQTRGEILRIRNRMRRKLLKQGLRLRALGEGRPDPYPELDEDWNGDSMVREHSEERSGAR